jgi:hypothetical protein
VTVPFVFASGQKLVDYGSEDGTESQGPKQSIGAVQSELDIGRSGRDEYTEQDSSCRRICRRLRIGDHVEGEKQKRAALQLLKGYRPRIAKPKRPAKQDTHVGEQESIGHITPRRTVDDHPARAGDEEREV